MCHGLIWNTVKLKTARCQTPRLSAIFVKMGPTAQEESTVCSSKSLARDSQVAKETSMINTN